MDDTHPSDHPRLVAVAVALLTLVALALRLWRLDDVPAGLHFDEAAHGLLVQGTIFRGQTPVFFSAYTGHEALYHYTLAPFLWLLGPTIFALRLPAALWSVALVPVLYLLGTRLWSWRVGLLAALAAACGGWLVHVGRIGFRANTLPVVSALAILFLYQALATQRRRDWIWSGALFGLSLYTYLAVRLLPLLAPLLLVYLLIWHRPVLRRSGRGIALFSLALVAVSVPFAYHMLRVPSDFFERFNQIAVGGAQQTGGGTDIARNVLATLGMFGLRGAGDGFFNLPGRPVFPGVAALPFYAGVLVALLRWRRLAHALAVLWLVVMLLPTILAADAPHFLRAIGAAPATYLVWGLGGAALWHLLDRVPRLTTRWRQIAAGALMVGAAGWWTAATAREYFAVWARRPELYYEYMQYATDAARAAQDVPADQGLLVSESYYRHATYLYLAPRTRTAQWLDARHAVVWPRAAPWTALISASTPTTEDINPLLVAARGEPYAPDGLFAYIKLQGDTIPPFEPPTPADARFGDAMELAGYNLAGGATPGGTLHLQLYGRALAAPGRELRLFVHVEDDAFNVVAQDDALGYDAREWQPGDQFISFHTLQLPAELPDSPLRLIVGLYDAQTGERFPVSGTGAQGDYVDIPLEGDS